MISFLILILIFVNMFQVGSTFTTPAASLVSTATNSSILDPWLMLLMERCTVINITNYIVIINVIVIITIITMSFLPGVLQSLLCCNLHALPLPRPSWQVFQDFQILQFLNLPQSFFSIFLLSERPFKQKLGRAAKVAGGRCSTQRLLIMMMMVMIW